MLITCNYAELSRRLVSPSKTTTRLTRREEDPVIGRTSLPVHSESMKIFIFPTIAKKKKKAYNVKYNNVKPLTNLIN